VEREEEGDGCFGEHFVFFSFSWTGGMTINSKIKAVGGSCSRSTVNLR
jgi:hypothetical protein